MDPQRSAPGLVRAPILVLAGVVAVLACAHFVWAAAVRVPFPFALEWQEGGLWVHAQRVLSGEPLYAEPRMGFTAFPYPPLFSWLSAAALWCMGDGLPSLRLVSLFGTGLCALGLAWCVGRSRSGLPGSGFAALLAVGLFLAGRAWAGDWLDVARIDSLCLGLLLACFAAQCGRPGLRRGLLAGVLGALACLTKQTALVPLACLWVALLVRCPRAALSALAGAGVLLVGTLGYLYEQSGEWLAFHLVSVLRGHRTHPPAVLGFWLRDMSWLLPTVMAVAVLPGARARFCRDGAPAFTLGLVLAAWGSRAHIGGYDNVLLPTLAAAAYGVGCAAAGLLRSESGGRKGSLVAGLVLLQFFVLQIPNGIGGRRPDEGEIERGQALVERLAAVPGDVLAPSHPELALMAGKPASLHWMALFDLSASGDGEWGRRLVGELEEGLVAGRWQALLLHHGEGPAAPLREFVQRTMRLVDERPEGYLGRPVTGYAVQPSSWWVPRP